MNEKSCNLASHEGLMPNAHRRAHDMISKSEEALVGSLKHLPSAQTKASGSWQSLFKTFSTFSKSTATQHTLSAKDMQEALSTLYGKESSGTHTYWTYKGLE